MVGRTRHAKRKLTSMKKIIALAAAISALAPGFALAKDASRTISIQGHVPVVCRATYDAQVGQFENGVVNLGQVREFCNSARGYKVVIEHTGSGDVGSIIVDGREIELSASGSTTIATVGGPAIIQRSLAYRPGDDSLSSMRISIQANWA